MPEPESFKQRQLEFYKESYVAENDKKEKLRGGVAFNLGVFTVLANVFVSVFDSMQRFEHSKLFWWFCVVVAISLFLGLVALYFLFRALGFPKTVVRVLSDWYPSTAHPESSSTMSPAFSIWG